MNRLQFDSAQHLRTSSGSCGERWVSRRTPCLAAVGRKVRPTHQVENSRATLEPASIPLLWRRAKLEAYERHLALYEQASGEKISDGLRVGIVLNRVMNSERFQTWALFRRELVDVSRARAAASGAYQMRRGANVSSTAWMEIDALRAAW